MDRFAVPAVCPSCKAVFSSPLRLPPGGRITSLGNTVEPCPGCGGVARIPDGQYQFDEKSGVLLFGPLSFSADELITMLNIVSPVIGKDRLKSKEIHALDRQITEATGKRRVMRQLAKWGLSSKPHHLLLAAAAFIGSCNGEINVRLSHDVSPEVYKLVTEQIRAVQTQTQVPLRPETTKAKAKNRATSRPQPRKKTRSDP